MKRIRWCVALLLLVSVVFFAGCETKLTIKMIPDPLATTLPEQADSPLESLPEVDPIETEPPEIDPLYGQWYTDMNLGEYMAYTFFETFGDEVEAPDEDLFITINLEFKEPNIFKVSMDMDRDSFENYIYAFKPVIEEYMYDMAAEEGMSKKEYNEMFRKAMGMDVDEYLDEMLEESIDQAMESFAEASYQGFFYEEDGTVYTADTKSGLEEPQSSFQVSLEKDTMEMTVKDMDEEEKEQYELLESMGLGFPWEFKRQYSF